MIASNEDETKHRVDLDTTIKTMARQAVTCRPSTRRRVRVVLPLTSSFAE